LDDLVRYRLDSANERLESARILLDAGNFRDSISRSYYAIFTAVRAVLAVDHVDFSKHAGVIAYFQKEYVKTGQFDKKYSKILQNAFQIRSNCDYSDFFIISKSDAEEQYSNAQDMINAITIYLQSLEKEEDKTIKVPNFEEFPAFKEIEEGNRKKGIEIGEALGEARNLVRLVEYFAKNSKVSIEESCRVYGCTLQEYKDAKTLLAKEHENA